MREQLSVCDSDRKADAELWDRIRVGEDGELPVTRRTAFQLLFDAGS